MAATRMTKRTVNCCYAGNQCEGDPAYPDIRIGPNATRPAYVSWPQGLHVQHRKGLVLVPDANGLWHNSRLLADQFAAAGYLTIVCPYNNVVRPEGAPAAHATQDPHLASSDVEKHRAYDIAISEAIGWLKSRTGNCNKIGLLAYQEGAQAAVRHLQGRGNTYIEACFFGTPVLNTLTELESFITPTSIALADEDDLDFDGDVAEHKDIEYNLKNSAAPYQISIYSHVHLGFAQRRRFTSKAEVFAKKQAFIQAITWMQEHLLNGE